MNRHFYKLKTPVYKSLFVRFRTETASSREFCIADYFWDKNSQFDEQCNMASPLWNVGLKHRVAGRPREGKLSALLTEGALYHLSFSI